MSDLVPPEAPPPPHHGPTGRIYVVAVLITAITGLVTAAGNLLNSYGGGGATTQGSAPSATQLSQSPSIQQTVTVTVAAPNSATSRDGEIVSPSVSQRSPSGVPDAAIITRDELGNIPPATSPTPKLPISKQTQPKDVQTLPNQWTETPKYSAPAKNSGGGLLTGATIDLVHEANPIGDPTAPFDGSALTSFDFVAKADKPAIRIVFRSPVNLRKVAYKNPTGRLLDHIVTGVILEAETTRGNVLRNLYFDIYREGLQAFDLSIDGIETLTITPDVDKFGRRYSLGDIYFE